MGAKWRAKDVWLACEMVWFAVFREAGGVGCDGNTRWWIRLVEVDGLVRRERECG